jgi:hypothetical protein
MQSNTTLEQYKSLQKSDNPAWFDFLRNVEVTSRCKRKKSKHKEYEFS